MQVAKGTAACGADHPSSGPIVPAALALGATQAAAIAKETAY